MLSKIHLKPESLSNFTIHCRSLLRDFLLASLRVPKCLTYRSVKNISTLSVHQTRRHLQTSHSRDGESTKSLHKQYNSSLIKWSGLLFFLMGRWGWRFCPALIHNLPLSFLQLTSYTATNKKSHESECSYRFVGSQVKIDSLVSRNPRKLGKKSVCL